MIAMKKELLYRTYRALTYRPAPRLVKPISSCPTTHCEVRTRHVPGDPCRDRAAMVEKRIHDINVGAEDQSTGIVTFAADLACTDKRLSIQGDFRAKR